MKLEEKTAIPGAVPRRDVIRVMALSPFALTLGGTARALADGGASNGGGPAALVPGAGDWRTWLVPSVSSLLPAAPPPGNSRATRVEVDELLSLQAQRTDAIAAIVRFWDAQGGIPVWTQVLLDTIKATGTNPVLASRALALFHTAIADATIAVWDSKFAHRRPQPSRISSRLTSLSLSDPRLWSYASEHAAIASAAAGVLNFLYPGKTAVVHGQAMTFSAIADEASISRLWGGASYRSDIVAGAAIGQAVAALAIARGQTDGSSAVWNAVTQPGRLFGPQYWIPTPPGFVFPPLLPLAGTWRPWIMSSGNQFRPPTPPALQGVFPNALFIQEAIEVKQTVDSLTPAQLQIAQFWADGAGTVTPPGHWTQLARQHVIAGGLSTPHAARVMAYQSVATADSAIACWDAKYVYWLMRPVTAIRNMVGQPFHNPAFVTPIVTPPFPAYTSGHSTFSGSSAAVLEYLFPGGSVDDAFGHLVGFDEAADQAAVSRLYGGIHFRSDNDEGLVCGRQIAGLLIARARNDGAE